MASSLLGGAASKETQAAEKVCRGVTESMTTLANEPSLGLYYVMEHIQRSTPNMIGDKQEARRSGELLHGARLDAEYALDELTLATSATSFEIFKRVAALTNSATVAAAATAATAAAAHRD
eukprot:336153-Prymnesium_polylepis.1